VRLFGDRLFAIHRVVILKAKPKNDDELRRREAIPPHRTDVS